MRQINVRATWTPRPAHTDERLLIWEDGAADPAEVAEVVDRIGRSVVDPSLGELTELVIDGAVYVPRDGEWGPL